MQSSTNYSYALGGDGGAVGVLKVGDLLQPGQFQRLAQPMKERPPFGLVGYAHCEWENGTPVYYYGEAVGQYLNNTQIWCADNIIRSFDETPFSRILWNGPERPLIDTPCVTLGFGALPPIKVRFGDYVPAGFFTRIDGDNSTISMEDFLTTDYAGYCTDEGERVGIRHDGMILTADSDFITHTQHAFSRLCVVVPGSAQP